MSEGRLRIRTGIPGPEQESGFMNATLQSAVDGAVDFSIATHVTVPVHCCTEKGVANYLEQLFGFLADAAEALGTRLEGVPAQITFEIEVGPGEEADWELP